MSGFGSDSRAPLGESSGELPTKSSAALSAYLDGELDAAAVRRLDRQLADDPELRRERDRLGEASARLAIRCEPDPEFVSRWRSRRETVSVIPRWTWSQLGFRLAAAAAVAIAAAGLSLWQGILSEPGAGPIEELDGDGADPGEFLRALEGQVLGASGPASADLSAWFDAASPEARPAAAVSDEPVLRIALGASFPAENSDTEPEGG